MNWRIKSLLGYDTDDNQLYAVTANSNGIVRSLDPSYTRWEAASAEAWSDIMTRTGSVWATEVPFIPETDDVLMTLEPRTPLVKTAANGDKWGGGSER